MDLQTAIEQIQQVISEPTSNLPAASLLLAAVTLVVLILVLGVTFFAIGAGSPRRDRRAERRQSTPAGETEETREVGTGRLATNALVILLAALALVVGYGATGTDAYCADTCHADHEAVVTAQGDAHSGVRCVRCHEEPLPFGAVSNLVSRTRFIVAEALPSEVRQARDIPSARCLRCHQDIEETIVVRPETGIRMAHEHPLEAGMSCADCHQSSGHGGPRVARGMTTCLACHDGVTADSACDLCHTADTSLASSADRLFGTVRLDIQDCSGCHEQDACDDCHGVRMPHDRGFLNRGHAKFAAFEKKEVCYGCHARSDCWDCHEPFERSGHVGNWRLDHQAFPFDSPCGCHQLVGVTRSFCVDCHDSP